MNEALRSLTLSKISTAIVSVLPLNIYLISLTKYYTRNRNHYGETVALYTGSFLFYSWIFWNKNAILGDNSYS